MDHLRTGDMILVMYRSASWHSSGSASDWSLRFEPIISWLHPEPNAKMEVVQLVHKQGKISLSVDHLIFTKTSDGGCAAAVMARDVSAGDRVMVPWIDGSLMESEVISVCRSIDQGAYA